MPRLERRPDLTKTSKLKQEAPIGFADRGSTGWNADWLRRELAEVAAVEAQERKQEVHRLRVTDQPRERRTVTLKTPWGEVVEAEIVWP